MVKISVEGDNLILSIQGMHKVWALKGKIEVPLSSVKSFQAAPDQSRWPAGLRLPGTFVPGVITAGSYYLPDTKEWTFWDVADTQNVIIIEFTDAPYTRAIIEVEDPGAAIETLSAAVGAEE